MIQVSFIRAGLEDPLFTVGLLAIPCVGDNISYSFEPINPGEWDPALLNHRLSVSNECTLWRVTQVNHLIRQLRPTSAPSHLVVVEIKPLSDTETE